MIVGSILSFAVRVVVVVVVYDDPVRSRGKAIFAQGRFLDSQAPATIFVVTETCKYDTFTTKSFRATPLLTPFFLTYYMEY